jgi:hypothetical protein
MSGPLGVAGVRYSCCGGKGTAVPETTLKGAAMKLGKSEKTVRRWVRDGAPSRVDKDGCYLVDPDALSAWRQARVSVGVSPAEDEPAAAPSEASAATPVALPVVDDDELGAIDDTWTGYDHDPTEAGEIRRTLEARSTPPGRREVVARTRLGHLLRAARSVVLVRLPLDADDVERVGREGQPLTHVVTRVELDDMAGSGGLKPLIESRLGPGRFQAEWIGPHGEMLYREVLELPDVASAAFRLRSERERAEAAAYEDARREAEAQARAAHDERLRRAYEAWAPRHAVSALVEAGRRTRDFDQRRLYDDVLRFLLAQAPQLYPRCVYDPSVVVALEPFLPRVPSVDFEPWRPDMLTPQELWASAWAHHAARTAFERDPRADPSRVALRAYDALLRAAPALGPRPIGDPAVWQLLEPLLPRPPRRAAYDGRRVPVRRRRGAPA